MKIGDIEFPYVDDLVDYWALSELQGVEESVLENMEKTAVIEHGGVLIGVLVPMEIWRNIQDFMVKSEAQKTLVRMASKG